MDHAIAIEVDRIASIAGRHELRQPHCAGIGRHEFNRGVIPDPANPYRYIQIQGQVVDHTEEKARAHIDALAEKYLGQRSYPYYQGETRVIYTIQPERVQMQG